MRQQPRKAFTLFGILILLVLLIIMLALLLPAVAKVREAAARSQSANNLKQIGIALHNYLSTFNVFPPGVDNNHFSTATYLLPYIEQDALFKLVDLTKSIDDKANATPRATVIRTFLSPMDMVMRVSMDYGATNYLFCGGSKPDLNENDGIFYLNSKVKIQDITDGTSNTLFTTETLKGDGMVRAVDMHRQHVLLKKEDLKNLKDEAGVQDFKDDKNIAANRCASWMDGRFLQGTFSATRSVNDSRPDVDCGGAGGLSGSRSLGQYTTVGFADGSVRTLAQGVKLETWKILAGRNDGQVVPADF
jgi:type II secretory pathway pseudopilin PulG